MGKTRIVFDRKMLIKLIVPMVIEQLLSVMVGMFDMIMVSGSGEEAVSGISLVNQINVLLIMVFAALSSGGAVVVSQYLGSGDKEKSCKAADQMTMITTLIATMIMIFALIFNKILLRLIFGSVDPLVMQNAVTYFYIIAISFPFLAVYDAGTAIFRVMGNSYIAMITSAIMNVINIIGNYILIYKFDMGVAGVAYSSLASRIVAAVFLVILVRKESLPVHIDKYLRFGWNNQMLGKILSIGIPQCLENGMFQIGKLLTQSLISSFGTSAIAANACGANVEMLADIPGSAMGLALVTIVGQCVGAAQYDEATGYTKKLIKVTYIFMFALNIVLFASANFIAGWYNLSDLGSHYAVQIIRYHSVCCVLIWPLAFTLASALRAAGDARFTLLSSTISMWIFRIALAYVIAKYMGVGVLGVWIAMTIDWLVRSILNLLRFKSGKWKTKSVVKSQVNVAERA